MLSPEGVFHVFSIFYLYWEGRTRAYIEFVIHSFNALAELIDLIDFVYSNLSLQDLNSSLHSNMNGTWFEHEWNAQEEHGPTERIDHVCICLSFLLVSICLYMNRTFLSICNSNKMTSTVVRFRWLDCFRSLSYLSRECTWQRGRIRVLFRHLK